MYSHTCCDVTAWTQASGRTVRPRGGEATRVSHTLTMCHHPLPLGMTHRGVAGSRTPGLDLRSATAQLPESEKVPQALCASVSLFLVPSALGCQRVTCTRGPEARTLLCALPAPSHQLHEPRSRPATDSGQRPPCPAQPPHGSRRPSGWAAVHLRVPCPPPARPVPLICCDDSQPFQVKAPLLNIQICAVRPIT